MGTNLIIQQVSQYTLLDWFELFGALLAFILVLLRIKKYWKDRINLSIELSQSSFYSNEGNMSQDETKIGIIADIRNKGKQPTTISKVVFKSDNKDFTGLKMNNYLKRGSLVNRRVFNPIRIEPNDRREVSLNVGKDIYLEDFKSMNAELTFKTSHKNILKTIKITKNED